ncbi:MAG: VWA domain-containing protein [Sandaracinaceae bacterium]|nr:VWA domain-containing protein [Sandaracinaceae bacterium]
MERMRGCHSIRTAGALLALSSLLSSCAADPSGATCASDADCADGFLCADGRCQARASIDAGREPDSATPRRDAGPGPGDAGPEDGSCGGEAVPFDYRPPNVLVIFDRSCSMRRRLEGTTFGTGPDDPETRWYVAREAILDLMTRFSTRVFWGLMAFPDPTEGCGMSVDTEVVPGAGTLAAIEAELRTDRIQPFGLCGPDNSDTTTQPRDTPTADAMMSALGLPALSDPLRRSFALLFTDGGVSCGVSNAQLRTLSASLRDAGIPIAVVGFATGATETTLEAIASEGGLVRPGAPPSYYVAESRADLDAVLGEIAARVVSCDLPLSTTPPDASAIFVNVDDAPLPMDPADGWTYDAATNTLTLHGTACDRLRDGTTRRIGVSFGCAPTACEPRPEVCNGLDEDCDDIVDEDCLM